MEPQLLNCFIVSLNALRVACGLFHIFSLDEVVKISLCGFRISTAHLNLNKLFLKNRHLVGAIKKVDGFPALSMSIKTYDLIFILIILYL